MRTSPGVTSRRLLGHLVSDGPAHRADLSRALEVSRTTVTNLVADLTRSGVLVPSPADAPPPASSARRPPLKQQLGISVEHGVLASVVFRMTSVTVTVGALDGRVLGVGIEELERDALGIDRMYTAHDQLKRVLAECKVPAENVRHLHLAVNTQCDRESGEVLTEQAAGKWRGLNPKQIAQQWTPAPVSIENTARLTGLAEYHALGAPGPRSLVYIHLSWGVTMGQVVDGEITSGSHGGAGELGHVSIDPMGPPCACANRGCLGVYAGIDTIAERAEAILGEGAGVPEVLAAVADGSQACTTIVEDVGEAVGRALAMVCNVADPDVIVLGGELSAVGSILRDAVLASVRRRALPLVTRTLEVTTARTMADPYATGRAALARMRSDRLLVEDLVAAVLDA